MYIREIGSDKILGCGRKQAPVPSLVCGGCTAELSVFCRKVLSVGRLLPPRVLRTRKETAQPAARNWCWLLKQRPIQLCEEARKVSPSYRPHCEPCPLALSGSTR